MDFTALISSSAHALGLTILTIAAVTAVITVPYAALGLFFDTFPAVRERLIRRHATAQRSSAEMQQKLGHSR